MVAFIRAGVCGNINALHTKAHGENKTYEEHLERVWEDIIHLLEEEFPLAIQTPAVPYVCPCEELPSSTTSQTPLQFTKLISYRAKENYSFLCGCSVASFKL